MLKILHTADWQIGLTFGQFEDNQANVLVRERISVVENIFSQAERYQVDAILCAGNLFNDPQPDEESWRAISKIITSASSQHRPIILLPGNHDPLIAESVYTLGHEFRKGLPDSVHIVDDENFELKLGSDAVLYSSPCKARAGDRDLAMGLPKRTPDDSRIRIGMVHGSVSAKEGSINYPISLQAPVDRGLDYLAAGGMHAKHEIKTDGHATIVFPGTPEPTSFSDEGAGYFAIASIRSGVAPRLRWERVNRWSWREETVASLDELLALANENLKSTVLKLRLSMTVDIQDIEQIEKTLNVLGGNDTTSGSACAFICDRTDLLVNVSDWNTENLDLPEAIIATIDRFKKEAEVDDQLTAPKAKRALLILQKMLKENGVAL